MSFQYGAGLASGMVGGGTHSTFAEQWIKGHRRDAIVAVGSLCSNSPRECCGGECFETVFILVDD